MHINWKNNSKSLKNMRTLHDSTRQAKLLFKLGLVRRTRNVVESGGKQEMHLAEIVRNERNRLDGLDRKIEKIDEDLVDLFPSVRQMGR